MGMDRLIPPSRAEASLARASARLDAEHTLGWVQSHLVLAKDREHFGEAVDVLAGRAALDEHVIHVYLEGLPRCDANIRFTSRCSNPAVASMSWSIRKVGNCLWGKLC
ncbi:unnamed protein product [Prunus brigantina]